MQSNRALKRAFPETAENEQKRPSLIDQQTVELAKMGVLVKDAFVPRRCSPGWKYNASQQTLHRMNCRRRGCKECGWYWSWTWRSAINAKVERDKAFKLPPARLALTLTMAEYPDYKVVYDCFRYFWQEMRKSDFPGVQYLCFPEENQTHDLIHFHLIIDKIDFMYHEIIRQHWLTAQRWAGVEQSAWVLRVERIKKNVAAYFAKYITKNLDGRKDEIPRRENWKGRYVRASKFFFGELTDPDLPYRERKPLNRATLVNSLTLQRVLEAGDELDRLYYQVREPLVSLPGFIEKADQAAAALDVILKKEWNPFTDADRAGPAPPDTLFDQVETLWSGQPYQFEKTSKKPSVSDLKNLDERLKEAGREKLKASRKGGKNV